MRFWNISCCIFLLSECRNMNFSGNQGTIHIVYDWIFNEILVQFEFLLDIFKRSWNKGSWQTDRFYFFLNYPQALVEILSFSVLRKTLGLYFDINLAGSSDNVGKDLKTLHNTTLGSEVVGIARSSLQHSMQC